MTRAHLLLAHLYTNRTKKMSCQLVFLSFFFYKNINNSIKRNRL